MALEIVRTKIQFAWLKRKVLAVAKRGPEKGQTVERKRSFKVTIGTYIEFNDGCTIVGPDGRVHKGRGTVARFNYKYRTWSVQRPQRCETNRVGYVFTTGGDPCWLKDQRESGFDSQGFERSFSPFFVKLCKEGRAKAEAGGPVSSSEIIRGVLSEMQAVA